MQGKTPTPIFDAAVCAENSPGGSGVPLADYGASNFITQLQTVRAGANGWHFGGC